LLSARSPFVPNKHSHKLFASATPDATSLTEPKPFQTLAAMGRKHAAAADDESLAAATMPDDLLAAADCGGVHGHALFFDALVQLIPPRFYLQAGDEDRP
jgi:hypothetical protein